MRVGVPANLSRTTGAGTGVGAGVGVGTAAGTRDGADDPPPPQPSVTDRSSSGNVTLLDA